MKNYEHQVIARARYKAREFFGLLFDCGTGKTRTAIQIAEDKEMPVLIIAPKNLCKQWKEAIEEHGRGGDEVLVVNQKSKTKKGAAALAQFIAK